MNFGPSKKMRSCLNRSLGLAVLLVVVSGCQRVEEVTRYTVPKEPSAASPHQTLPAAEMPQPSAPASGPQSMLAAMLREGEQVWFFKVVGSTPVVRESLEGVRRMLTSVTLEAGEQGPKWILPDGWSQKPASGMRFATVDIPTTAGTLELTVTPLRAVGDPQEYALANVNRWRQQLGLTPTDSAQLFGSAGQPGELMVLETRDGRSLQFIDIAAESVPEVTDLPDHPPVNSLSEGLTTTGGPVDRAEPGLTYSTPTGWTPGKTDGMRKAAFVIQEGESSAEMTVIALAAGSGDLLSNVNRWREQVALGPLDAASLPEQLTAIPVDDAKGEYVEIAGPPDAPKRESTFGVICPRGDQVWYFKLKGDAALVERQREAFQAFLRSVDFAGQDGADHVP